MRDDDDWQLFASYYDYTRIKFKLSFNLWRNLFPVNPTAILPRSRYVLLYFNGSFDGLYLLAEKNDRKLYGLNETIQNNSDDSLIFQAKDATNLSEYEADKWEQDWPNEEDGYFIMDDVMVDLITFINHSTSDTDFFNQTTGIFSKFDKNNTIDFFLFNYFIMHLDFWNKNYFIVRNTNPANFSLIPWDFDLTYGQNISDPEFFEDPTTDIEDEIREKNLLFDRLLSNQSYRENCSQRWEFLRAQVWSNESISNMVTT
ncbi:MAG: CotH kinase family protein, partial [Candidatus Hermodarchaeota archaeon]